MFDHKFFLRNVMYLIGATRGGPMRARIMRLLFSKPMNPNQIADKLGVDYKTVTHHLDVLKKHNWVIGSGDNYGGIVKPALTPEQREVFEGVLAKLGKDF